MGRTLRNQAGFTLMELLVAAVVALVFAFAGWGFQRSQARELNDQAALIDATDTLRASLSFLAREIRQTAYDPKLTALVIPGTKGISDARSDRLHIQWDNNESGVIDVNSADPLPESVIYSYDATSRRILRTVAGVSEPLVGNVSPGGFAFEYYDILGNQMIPSGNPAQLTFLQRDLVTFIRIRLGVDAVGATRPTALATATRVTVRNRILDKL